MAPNATTAFEPVLDMLNTTAAAAPDTPRPPLRFLTTLLLDVRLIVSALTIIYLGAHGALRRPPSASAAAPPRGGTKRDDDDHHHHHDDDDGPGRRFAPGLEPSDALLFPVMAGVVLAGMYYLVQWLQDPALLNTILRCYVASVSVASLLTLYVHGVDLAASLLFPTYWRGRDGLVRRVDQLRRAVALCDAAGNGAAAAAAAAATSATTAAAAATSATTAAAAATSATTAAAAATSATNTGVVVVVGGGGANPLPGVLGLAAPTQKLRTAAWAIRGLLSRRWDVDLFARGVGEVKTQVRFSHVVALLLSVGTAVAYFSTESPFLSNVLGYGMCYGSFLLLSPTDFMTGSLVLGGLFFYDVLMVFYTPYMITVATTIDVPIKLTFGTGRAKSMLGLGDIVIPGMVIGWALRLDLWLHYVRKIKYEATELLLVEKDTVSGEITRRSETKHREVKAPYVDVRGKWGDDFWSRRRGGRLLSSWPRPGLRPQQQLPPHLAGARFAKVYFCAAMAGYALGMAVTVVVMRVSQHGQPALLYLVPGVLGALAGTAWARGELGDLWAYTEDGSLDTVDVVVDLDGEGNAIRRIGALEDGVVDTTRDEKERKGKEKEKKKGGEDEKGVVGGKGRRRQVLLVSVEAVEELGGSGL